MKRPVDLGECCPLPGLPPLTWDFWCEEIKAVLIPLTMAMAGCAGAATPEGLHQPPQGLEEGCEGA